MTKEDLAAKVVKSTQLTRRKALEAVQAVFDTLKNELAKSDKPIALRGFGKFIIQRKKARGGRNPKTGEAATISARRVAQFKAADTLKEIVNSSPEN